MLNGEFVLDIDYKRYVAWISRALQQFYRYPQGSSFIRLRQNRQGEIIGWDVDDEECRLNESNSYLMADEAVKKYRDGWCFNYFSYHFQPKDDLKPEKYYVYRIDLDKNSLHANPDGSLDLPEHMEYPEHLKLCRPCGYRRICHSCDCDGRYRACGQWGLIRISVSSPRGIKYH